MSAWSHFNPVKIVGGEGCMLDVAQLCGHGNWLFVTSEGFTRRGTTAEIVERLSSNGSIVRVFDSVQPNPNLHDLERLTALVDDSNLTGILALGGGSTLDLAKVLSVSTGNPRGMLSSSLRGASQRAWSRRLKLVVAPTTAGTGAEVTPFATVWDTELKQKHSLSGPALFPDLCLLDPILTIDLPRDQTLYGALDATSHALESLWNINRTRISGLFSLAALELLVFALPAVLEHPNDLPSRDSMQQASLLAGIAISQTRTAVAHSISYPLTLHFGVPHGLASGFTLEALLNQHLEQMEVGQREKNLLRSVKAMLGKLDLRKELEKYVDLQEIPKVRDEMENPGRVGNFSFKPDIERTLEDALFAPLPLNRD